MRMVEIAASEFSGEPVFFKLAGEQFECLAFVPLGTQMDLADYDYSLPKTLAFFTGILKDEAEVKRFQKFIHGETQIHFAMLTQTLEKVIEVYAGRPLGTSEASSDGPRKTSVTSKRTAKPKAKRSSG